MSNRKAAAEPLVESNGLAITSARVFSGTPECDQFTLTLAEIPIEFEIDRVRFDHGEMIGQLTVRTGLAGTRALDGVLSVGTLNLSSPTARKTRAKILADLSRAPQVDWERLIEELAIRVTNATRTGGEAVDLRAVARPAAVDSLDVHGIQVLDKHPIIVFGDGGSGKSLLALYIGGELVRRGLNVLLADWELSESDHRGRLEDLFGADMPRVFYARCSRPMSVEADRLRRLVRLHQIDYLICDSVAFACDGRPEDAEVAARYFQSLRQIGVGSLNVAHVNKSDESDKKPFGSTFWHNGARSTWNCKVSDDSNPHQLTVGLYNRKANLGPLLPPVGFRIGFEAGQTQVRRVDLADVHDLSSGLPLKSRIRQCLSRGAMTVQELADTLEAKPNSVQVTVGRMEKDEILMKIPSTDGKVRLALVERRAS